MRETAPRAEALSSPCDRIQYLDVLRVFAVAAVVFIHASITTYVAGRMGTPQWHFVNVFTSLVSAGVPVFFMISGAVLLDSGRAVSVGHTLRDRVPRLLVPFLVWSLAYVAFRFAAGWHRSGVLDWTAAGDGLRLLPVRPVAPPLWFMYVIIPLYVLSPLLKRLVDSLSRNLAVYLLVLWGLFSCLVPTVVAFFGPPNYGRAFQLDVASLGVAPVYVGYFIVGYYLMKLRRPISKKWLVVVICVDAAIMVLGTWWRTKASGTVVPLFFDISHVFTVIMSCALFLLCKECLRGRRLGRRTGRALGVIAPLTFGVYLVHAMVIEVMTNGQPMLSIKALVAYYGAELLASLAFVLVLSAIKPLCYVFLGRRYTKWWRTGGAVESAG